MIQFMIKLLPGLLLLRTIWKRKFSIILGPCQEKNQSRRATPVVLRGTGGSWQCCLWKTELSWRYWLWLPLKIVLSPSDAYWYLWLAKDPDNMDFSCEWALKTSHDRLFFVFQRFFQKWTALSDCVRHPSVALVCYPGYSPNLALSPVVLVKSEPLQSCATVRT